MLGSAHDPASQKKLSAELEKFLSGCERAANLCSDPPLKARILAGVPYFSFAAFVCFALNNLFPSALFSFQIHCDKRAGGGGGGGCWWAWVGGT